MAKRHCTAAFRVGLWIALWVQLSSSFLFDGPTAACPNPAKHCLNEVFNRVLENQGCLGCQTGCQPGYIMTANPRYYQADGGRPGGRYIYRGVAIANNVNVSEPQWVCLKGNTCREGFFYSEMYGIDTCSWCGSGCASCISFNHCQSCFSGFWIDPHALPDSHNSKTCSHSDVPCPAAPSHCLHATYVANGIGCAGCHSCNDGYLVTYNPSYVNISAMNGGTYEYKGLQIHHGVDVNEPRYLCAAGDSCRDGWYSATIHGTVVCTKCSVGCSHCSSRTRCLQCQHGFHLVEHSDNSTFCSSSES